MKLARVIRLAQAFAFILASLAWSYDSEARVSYTGTVERWSKLKTSPSKLKLRHHWMPVLAGFREVVASADPELAPKALYMEAKVWEELYRVSRRRDDLVQSHRAAMRLANEYRFHRLADDGLWIAAEQADKTLGPRGRSDELLLRLLREHPGGDMAPKARARLGDKASTEAPKIGARGDEEETKAELALSRLTERLAGRQGDGESTAFRRVRSWTGKTSRRIVLELSQPLEYQVARLDDERFEVRMQSRFDPEAVKDVLKQSGVEATVVHLGNALVVRFRESSKRVMAVESFVLEDPFRLILEVSYEAKASTAERPAEEKSPEPISEKPHKKPKPKPPLVVIDPGHGGRDGGAKGHGGVLEKELTLKVALNLERELKQRGIDVLLTRRDDRFVSLEDRTALANLKDASLFVSIHLNAHSSKKTSGVETYFLDTTDDKYSLRLAATENKTSEERVSEIQLAMVGLSMRLHTEESEAIAAGLQRSMVDVAQRYRKGGVRNLGVKSSLFYVLLGARMPAVLTELGFITNPADAELLSQRWYRRKLAASMARTIREALSLTKPTNSLKSKGN